MNSFNLRGWVGRGDYEKNVEREKKKEKLELNNQSLTY